MNPTDSPHLPAPWPDLLAAYADGELDPALRATVERWLGWHPAAMDAVIAQRQLSPENWPLWQQAEPPAPSEAQWNVVHQGIRAGIDSPPMPARPRHGGGRRVGMYFAGGVAAALAAFVIADVVRLQSDPTRPFVVREPSVEPPVDFTVLPMATDADVDIERVAGAGSGWLPVGDGLLLESLILAREDEVLLEEAEPHPAWPGGTPRMTTAPGDAPMIFAARSR
jgi:hypothetical protein